MADTQDWLDAVRTSHDRMAELVGPLTAEQVTGPSYASEWTIAQVASHLGSQAEIFGLFLDAGLTGNPAPGGEVFGPIWDRWNALPPTEQVTESLAANERLVASLEQIPDADRAAFSLSLFGFDLDLAGFAGMRLGEHAVHVWDIAVALDPSAELAPDAVDLLIDTLPRTAARAGKPVAGFEPLTIETTAPERSFRLTVDPEVTLTPDAELAGDVATLPAGAFIRLVFGRLGSDELADDRIAALRDAFPGF